MVFFSAPFMVKFGFPLQDQQLEEEERNREEIKSKQKQNMKKTK